jgi:sugar O-acyltransferase (sialic acid O-acetyltransferase NeuD family)
MMKRVLILGAGGFGREMYHWLLHHPDAGRAWEVGGYIDDRPNALEGFELPVRIVSTVKDYIPGANDLLVCAIGQPKLKRPLCEDLRRRGAKFLTFVHPSVVMGGKVELGEGVVLCPGVVVTSFVRLGDMVMVNCCSSVGHDVEIGAYTTLCGHCDITGHCVLGESVFVGSGASVIPGVKVGNGAVVGAGSVVIRAVKDGASVFGNPASTMPA